MLQASLHQRERMPISTPAAQWKIYNKRFTLRTQEHYSMVLCKFLDSLPKKLTVGQLSSWHIQHYLDLLMLRAKNRTANAHLTAIKSFYKWLSQNYGIPNHCRNITMLTEDPPKQRVLSQEEYLKVLSVSRPEEADCIKFLANTGIRATEACQLTWQDISPDQKWLTVHGKGRKLRIIPLNKVCRDIIAKYKPETNIQFSKNNRHGLYRLCKRLSERATIPRFGPHAIRHYVATELYGKIPDSYLSRFLGHASFSITEQVYVHFKFRSLAGCTDSLNK